jgi:hypothetical protein
LRTPGLSALCGKKFTLTEGFSWTNSHRKSRTIFNPHSILALLSMG